MTRERKREKENARVSFRLKRYEEIAWCRNFEQNAAMRFGVVDYLSGNSYRGHVDCTGTEIKPAKASTAAADAHPFVRRIAIPCT